MWKATTDLARSGEPVNFLDALGDKIKFRSGQDKSSHRRTEPKVVVTELDKGHLNLPYARLWQVALGIWSEPYLTGPLQP